jgi:endoglucanase
MKREVVWLVAGIFFFSSHHLLRAQPTTPYIVVDQFGYLPDAVKIAAIRNPQTGFDSFQSFSPGDEYALIDESTGASVLTAGIQVWDGGAEDDSSGDQVWWFDFSSVTETGDYYVLDVENNVRSYAFRISPSVYNEVLKHAVRTFFYQRVGYAKEAQYAGEEWADGASHMGNLQDPNCRLFSDANNSATERDLSGGWYDAGDYNKYTNWTANYVVEMMKAYLEAPDAWGDDYNIPESGNGVPDLLDEARWGVDHLLRLQEEDGGVLSIVSESQASPPSGATGQSLYGPATTSASLNTAGALAISAKVYAMLGEDEYATELESAAENAWDWAEENPEVLFRNNDPDYNSNGIGAGQQEEDDYQRLMSKLEAACFLFDLTKDVEYQTFFDANYESAHLIDWNYAYPYEGANQEALIYYTSIPEATTSVVNDIVTTYTGSMNSGENNFPAYNNDVDPYRAHLDSYTWGSNSVKALKGNMFMNIIAYGFDNGANDDAYQASLNYINYIHGLNPLNFVFLSNMYRYGAENGVNEFYHTWFSNGSALWDRLGESTYGPAPGFLVGGPNPSYERDGCCPDGCGGTNNEVCSSEELSPPMGQPDQKSYKDFNTSWPLNSWSVTENSCGYQINYIRLLSKFVNLSYDCNGTLNGSATVDICGTCTGGTTGVDPVTNTDDCQYEYPIIEPALNVARTAYFEIYPNPSTGYLKVYFQDTREYQMAIFNMSGGRVWTGKASGQVELDLSSLKPGSYVVRLTSRDSRWTEKVIIR